MQTENEIGVPQVGDGVTFTDAAVPPMNPVITTKPGYTTSQFGLTAVVTVICAVAMWFGYEIQPAQIDGYLALTERIAGMVIPFLALLGTIVTYINSRGKIASNVAMANSAVQVAQVAGIAGIGATLGGKNWKDPQRYINIGQMVSPFVPGIGGVIGRAGTAAAQEVLTSSRLSADEQALLKRLMEKAEGR